MANPNSFPFNRSSHLYRSYDNGSPGMHGKTLLILMLTASCLASVNDVVIHPNQGELISCDQAGAIKQWDLSENTCTLEMVSAAQTTVDFEALFGVSALPH